jgi:hypothetical protein
MEKEIKADSLQNLSFSQILYYNLDSDSRIGAINH